MLREIDRSAGLILFPLSVKRPLIPFAKPLRLWHKTARHEIETY